jgi:transcriptional regulator with XRE-family HTH domain
MYILTFMSRSADTARSLPPQVQRSLEKLGGDLRIARERRKESLRAWAQRMGISVPTLQRMEAGDATVGVSAYVTALWLVGRLKEFEQIADPAGDEKALSLDILASSRRRKP